MYQNKILYGFSDIYVCRDNEIPIPIKGAISIEINIENEVEYARLGGVPSISFNINNEGNGQMEVLGLNKSEQTLLLGYKEDSNGGLVVSNATSPMLHLLFSRKCADGSKQLYHVYNVRFNNKGLNASTIVEGSIDADNMILDFDVIYNKDYGYYYTLNSNDNPTVANNWFNQLQYPNM